MSGNSQTRRQLLKGLATSGTATGLVGDAVASHDPVVSLNNLAEQTSNIKDSWTLMNDEEQPSGKHLYLSGVITWHGSVFVPSRNEWHHDFRVQTFIGYYDSVLGPGGINYQKFNISSSNNLEFGLSTNDAYFGYYPSVSSGGTGGGFTDEQGAAVIKTAAQTAISLVSEKPEVTVGLSAANLAYDLFFTNNDSQDVSPTPDAPLEMKANYYKDCNSFIENCGWSSVPGEASNHLRFFAEHDVDTGSEFFNVDLETKGIYERDFGNEELNAQKQMLVFSSDSDPAPWPSSAHPNEMTDSEKDKFGIYKFDVSSIGSTDLSRIPISPGLLKRALKYQDDHLYIGTDLPIKSKDQL